MAKIALEQLASSTTTPISSYDSTKWNLGSLFKQYTGPNAEDNYISTIPNTVIRPMEESTAFAVMYPHVITISPTIDWVFLVENLASASALRRVMLYEYNKSTNLYSWRGFITLTLPTATAHTIRGFRVARYVHTTGTVGVSGTAVTGSSTQFQTERIAAGARIGFGSTDPEAITTWYPISSITNDTSLTLGVSAGTISAGTAYVIEELRPMLVTTNATIANGGLFVAKGVNYNDFTTTGTTISASASTVDNLKLVYKLSDAATTTLQVGGGLMIDDEVSKTQHDVYIINGTTTVSVFKVNVRGSGTITTGQMVLTGSDMVITGAQAVTGTTSQTNNGRLVTASHGPGNGVKSLYFVTTNRIYRAAVSNITSGNTTWQSDNRIEATPGGSNTIPLSTTLASIEYIGSADTFIITTTGTSSAKSYITQYPNTSGDLFDYVWGADFKLQDASTSSTDAPSIPANTLSVAFSVWSENGIAHICRNGTVATNMRVVAIPFLTHWDFPDSLNQFVISPKFIVPASKIERVNVLQATYLGLNEFQVPTEPVRLFYRTTGIDDNSGAWTALNKRGDINLAGVTTIQFKVEYSTLGLGPMIPARLYGLTLIYEDETTDSHYLPSADLSNKTTKTFAWKFQTAFGTTVPTLRVRLYNAVTNGLIDDDDSVTQTGTWEKSTNGTTWGAYNNTDKSNDTTFIRFIPASVPDNVQVRALLTQA